MSTMKKVAATKRNTVLPDDEPRPIVKQLPKSKPAPKQTIQYAPFRPHESKTCDRCETWTKKLYPESGQGFMEHLHRMYCMLPNIFQDMDTTFEIRNMNTYHREVRNHHDFAAKYDLPLAYVVRYSEIDRLRRFEPWRFRDATDDRIPGPIIDWMPRPHVARWVGVANAPIDPNEPQLLRTVATTAKRPGVITRIIEIIKTASQKKPITKDEILAEMVKSFPDRAPQAMKNTIGSQIPSGLRSEKGIVVQTNKAGGYWLE